MIEFDLTPKDNDDIERVCNEIIDLLTVKYKFPEWKSLLIVKTLYEEHPATEEGYEVILKEKQ